MHIEDDFLDLFGLLRLLLGLGCRSCSLNSDADTDTAMRAARAMSIILFIVIGV